MRYKAPNKREEKINITLFKALEFKSWDFVSGKSHNFVLSGQARSRALLSLACATLMVMLLIGSVSVPSVNSQVTFADLSIGNQDTILVYPTIVETDDWAGVESVLTPDLDEHALYQQFSAKNSAYVPLPLIPIEQTETVASSTPNPEVLGETLDTDSAADVMPPQDSTDAVEDPVPATPEQDQGTSSAKQTALYKKATDAVLAFFSSVTNALPFASESTTTVPALVEEVTEEVLEPVVEPSAEKQVASTTDAIEEVVPETTEKSSTTPEIKLTEPEPVVVPQENQSEVPTTTVSENLPATSTPVSQIELPVDISTTSTSTVFAPRSTGNRHTITLKDFALPELKPGEFVTGIQLRASLGAQVVPVEGEYPQFLITYRSPEMESEIGTVLIDSEVSNAINGGYFLFALPTMSDFEKLSGLEIDVTFIGDRDDLDGAYLDALWLEVDTRTITRDDLMKRSERELSALTREVRAHEFVSTKFDFNRFETPSFNLRYNSQRSRVTQTVRSLLGRNKVEINEVAVRHRSEGLLGIVPEVNVTKDGLISISIPESERSKMKPGEYEIDLTLAEGSYQVEDTFNFQWGMLAINPDKTQYEMGESATISMGALSPNGNTVCEADLRLYIIDADEYIYESPVERSGLCDGNNVIDVPDYSARFTPQHVGIHEMYLERLNEQGEVISHTSDTFEVVPHQLVSLRRVGPTRIFPPAVYPMEITVEASESFRGTLTERVPVDFEVYNTDAQIKTRGDYKELSWDVNILGSSTKTVSYDFDAPDISPYLYELGPASLESSAPKRTPDTVASTSASSTTDLATSQVGQQDFVEHRQWQIASDAVGKMLLFWDDSFTLPSGWTCISCAPTDPAFELFVYGSSTASTTGGTLNHTHTATTSVANSALATTEPDGSGSIANVAHSHDLTPNIAQASSVPLFRDLQLIEYTAGAGEPTDIPNGAIAIFDVASSSLPADWTRYEAQDGYYVRSGNVVGTTGGSNEHTHAITGVTTNASNPATEGSRGGGTQALGATAAHNHTLNATATVSISNEPPHIEVVLAKLGATSSPVNDIIAMWSDEVPSGWLHYSDDPGDPFTNRFIKASTSYGNTGGTLNHTPVDVLDATTQGPSATTNSREGSSGASNAHTHTVNFEDFSDASNLPPYFTLAFAKRQGNNPVYEQLSYRWYVNDESNQTPTDPWPSGASDLEEGAAIDAASIELMDGDEIRLRINAAVSNATSTAGAEFKLQYAAADTCSAAGSWFDVGDAASSTVWRGYDNGAVSDHSTLSSTTLASTTVGQTYEENGYASTTPNDISLGGVGEWDFVLQDNGAVAGTNYCFRLVEIDGSVFTTYTSYPQLLTNGAPNTPTLSQPFDNKKSTTTTGMSFRFVTSDPEGEDLHYQIQVDNDYDFGSAADNATSIGSSTRFINVLAPVSDKAPFTSGQIVQFNSTQTFTDGDTYYWRVRAQDTGGSGEWGEWSTPFSFTVDTTLGASAWFQTETEQFDTNTLVGIDTTGNQMDLATGSTTGTTTSSVIDFDDGSDNGSAWESFEYTDSGTITYRIQYLTDASTWAYIPDSDLANNSTGLGSSPVSLLDLDTDTYNQIRIEAVLTTGSSPAITNWTINWGYRVEVPTITKLFPNEKTGTTTPVFEFTTTDPEGFPVSYEISWSATTDFAASTTRNSVDDLGFTNINDGGEPDPYTSGDTIQFQLQPADALTNNQTYWWRVRAYNATSTSLWTDAQSFTVDTNVVVSTWFQTTEEQFDTDILSGTDALTSDVIAVATTATEALVVYGEGTQTTPRYRQWDGTSWGDEGSLTDIGSVLKWVKTKAATTREEYVAVTVDTDADVNAQVFATGEWGDLVALSTNVGDINARGIDVTYETLSGDAMVVYCNNAADPGFAIWDGTSWDATTTVINVTETSNCEWVQLASNPTSDEIIALTRGADGNPYTAFVWDGDTWGNENTLGVITDTDHEGMAVAYEESGDQAMVVTSDGNPARFEYAAWNGTDWTTTAGTQGLDDDFEWGTLVADVGSDELALCYQDEDTNIGMVRWSGSAWQAAPAFNELLTTPGKAKTDPGFSCVFEDGGLRDNYILTAYTNTTQTLYADWDNANWTSQGQLDSLGDTITSELQRTGDGTILGVFFEESTANGSLWFSEWDGSSWSTADELEDDVSVGTTPYGRPYSIAPRNPGTQGTTIVSPGIDFDDGSGPYWSRLSWNQATPGGSAILYSLQYYDGDSWEFIPDADLSGNESGITNGPIDLTGLNTVTYNLIRPYAALSCDGANNCPELQDWTLEWAGGINVSGTLYDYTQATPVDGPQVAVAVNGVLDTGKVGSVSGGVWSIANVNATEGDVITVFVNGTNPADVPDANEAVGIARYSGQGDITGMNMFERHVSLGSDSATSTPLTNADIALYNASNDEDAFINISGSTLDLCADAGCDDVRLYINASTTYSAGGNLITHDVENYGTFIATTTLYVGGSWDDNATSTLTNSTIIFEATSTVETIDQTGAVNQTFNNVVFGTSTTNGASWSSVLDLDINGDLTVASGTLARAGTDITVAGDLTNGVGGFWTGLGTTTFDGSAGANWEDQNPTLQNVGYVEIGNVVADATNKVVTLTGNVAAHTVTIGGDDTLDVSGSFYDITVYSHWTNNGTFLARSGEVVFAATTSGKMIDAGGDDFYDLTFNGVGGDWTFTETTLTINNDLTIATGTLTMTTATTSLGGSFSAAGGAFSNSNSVIDFTSSGAETITASGTNFTNVFANLYFSGSGSWDFLDVNATATRSINITSGSVTFPTGVLAVGWSLADTGGSFDGNGGTVQFYSTSAQNIQAGGSSFNNLLVSGSGTFTFLDANATLLGDLTTTAGTLILPSGTISIGGSLTNTATFDANSGQVTFNSADSGETINPGDSSFYDVVFDSTTGGWTLSAHATTTNNLTLTNAGDWTLLTGQTVSVGGAFANNVGGTSTTWAGSILSLESGVYALNTKTDIGDQYDTLRVAAPAGISMWNSAATTTSIISGGYLYSQNHASTSGDLYVYGDYVATTTDVYWSYGTDFDGTDISTTSPRQVNVYFASGATAAFTGVTFEVVGTSTASSSIQTQGAGTYTISVSGGTTTAQYYDFLDLGLSGLTLTASTVVSTLRDGAYTVGVDGGTAISLASTTIATNPAKQIYNVTFATTTAISASNVTLIGGATSSSYWWFREGAGNLYGEAYDANDDNPGDIRFDDSALTVTISGTVYSDDGETPLAGGTCNGSLEPVTVVVDGVIADTGSCGLANGQYSISNISIIGDPTVTVFLDDAAGGETAVVVTKTITGDVTGLDLYQNRVIVRHEDTEPMTIADMAVFDAFNGDDDVEFDAATGTPNTLRVFAGNELHVWATTTFTPGGDLTLEANASNDEWDGTLHVANGATFTGAGTSTYTIGGSIQMATSTTFVPASTVVVMNATTTNKTINVADSQTLTLNELQFTGVGGAWNLNGNASTTADIYVATGTLMGTGDLILESGSFYGNGLVSLGGGTVTLYESNVLGGTQGWTFNDLVLGDGTTVGTTSPAGTATTTVGGTLSISNAHFLDAGASQWRFTGSGTVFTETGTFLEDTSSVTYAGTSNMNITATDYYNLTLDAPTGSPTFSALTPGIQVFNNLTVGGTATTTVSMGTTALNVDGDMLINPLGVFEASGSGSFTIAGSYENNGTFTANGGTLTFDGAGTPIIYAGESDFATVIVNGTGDFLFLESATATDAFTLTAANTFQLGSFESLAVGGTFTNSLSDAATFWTNSTLFLYGGGNYTINASTDDDTYGTLLVDAGTQIRMWNSDASTTTVRSTGSLYSMDHADNPGDLYIYGDYSRTSGTDYWAYDTDFDGTDISGSPRQVDVYFEDGATFEISGGSLFVEGGAAASTTIQNQGTGTYSFTATSTASTSFEYVDAEDMDINGLVFGGSADVNMFDNVDLLAGVDNGTAVTVYSSVITQNPAENFFNNIFNSDVGVSNAANVTAIGSTASAWRFEAHSGNLDGEDYDVDPGPASGNPGYLIWDDSTSTVGISGFVLQSDRSTRSNACDDVTPNIVLAIDGSLLQNASSSCSSTDGSYSITNISLNSEDVLTVYIDGAYGDPERGVTVSVDPVSAISDMNIYEDHVIVRHEGNTPLTIADMATFASSSDPDIQFGATTLGTDILTLDPDVTLLVWTNKEFEPQGNIVTGGGAGNQLDGTVELLDDATLTLANGEAHSFGGDLTMGTNATFAPAESTVTFTSFGSGRGIDTNESGFYNVILDGAGTFTASDTVLSVANDLTITDGALTLPVATTTITGSLSVDAGSFDANGGIMEFDGTAAETIVASTSDFATLIFTGSGSWGMNDVNATATESVTIESGSVTLPSGTLALGGSFRNTGGTVVHNTSELIIATSSTATLLASTSDLYAVTFGGGGSFIMEDNSLTLLDTLTIQSGSLDLATGTLSIGGSFIAAGGTFNSASGTILFNSSDVGEVINPGSSSFYNVNLAGAAGGWTIAGDATTTNNFSLTNASSFTLSPDVVLAVEGVFTNSVGGTATVWTDSILKLLSGTDYALNSSTTAGETYGELVLAADMNTSAWNSSAATTTLIDYTTSSFYSQNHASTSGYLYIYGTYAHATGTEYWSYDTDFDGTDLSGGNERAVNVFFVDSATSSFAMTGGTLQMLGAASATTTVQALGSGTYDFDISGGTLNAQYYAFRDMSSNGLDLSGTPTISALSNGDFEVSVASGKAITVAHTVINANASKIFTDIRFATTTGIAGTNVELTGSTVNTWRFRDDYGTISGEDYDIDGVGICGQIRFDDSGCLLTEQTHYRFRNDNGGLGVPTSEWYDTDWELRKSVRIQNDDSTTYTDAVVELEVLYEAGDMQADFDDLRFTTSDGTTLTPHFVGSTTNSVAAEVWVKVPTLAAQDTTVLYMYYKNGGATSVSSSTATFIAADDFEDNNLDEYSGANDDKLLFSIGSSKVYGGAYSLDNNIAESSQANDGGMARFDQTVSQGETIRFMQYVDVVSGADEVCTMFGVQSPVSDNNNYAVCVEQTIGSDYVSITKDVVDTNENSGTELARTPGDLNFTTGGWYEIEIDWGMDNSIFVSLYDDNETLVATTTATDSVSPYTSGGYGFTYWFNRGAWDNVTSRPTLENEPTVSFGAEIDDAGASWAGALDTAVSFDQLDTVRLRFAIENSGLSTTTTYDLEFAEKDTAPSCEAVDTSEYAPVPNQASCGSSAICMQTTSNYADGAATADLLSETVGAFAAGEAIESPSSATGNITLAQNEFTEIEYTFTPTVNATATAYCLRVTGGGADLDTYLSVAEMGIIFSPSITSWTLNNGSNIIINPGGTTTVYATGTISDQNGYTDFSSNPATTTIYRSGVGEACAEDENNCYRAVTPQCAYSACSGNTCTLSCSVDIYYFAEPTDLGTYSGQTWRSYVEVIDDSGASSTAQAPSIDLQLMNALDVASTTQAISYGSLAPSTDTQNKNATTTLINIGNGNIDISLDGTDLSDGAASLIEASNQVFASSTFTYGSCGYCLELSSTSTKQLGVDLLKQTSTSTLMTDDVYWGIQIPFGVAAAPHSGLNTFYAVSD